jgi:hypothetical protein
VDKNLLPAAPTPVPITIAVTAPAFPSIITVTVTVAATASEDIAKSVISIPVRSATVPTTIARVVAVNKLIALLIQASASTASLGHGVARHADE